MSTRVISQAVLGVLALSILGGAVAGFIWGIPAFLLAMASGTLSLVIVLMWGSLQQMEERDEMEFEQALSYAAPSVEEEQKRALLRTLKDLEYELSVGKISRQDYDEIYAEVAEKAKRMIALTDEAMKARVAAAEALVSSRLENTKSSRNKQKKRSSEISDGASDSDAPPDSDSALDSDALPDSSQPDSDAPPDSSQPDSESMITADGPADSPEDSDGEGENANEKTNEKDVRS